MERPDDLDAKTRRRIRPRFRIVQALSNVVGPARYRQLDFDDRKIS
jgi:hypothetical protein